jgi:ATP-dependent Lon protease
MTGEITLSGLVFPVGGIKGKVLAARRAGLKRIVLPKRNEPDLKDIPKEALEDLEVTFVESIEELLQKTLDPASNGSEGQEEPKSPRVPPREVGYEGPGARVSSSTD